MKGQLLPSDDGATVVLTPNIDVLTIFNMNLISCVITKEILIYAITSSKVRLFCHLHPLSYPGQSTNRVCNSRAQPLSVRIYNMMHYMTGHISTTYIPHVIAVAPHALDRLVL